MKLLNAGCGTHYAEGWVNTDVWSDSISIVPDVIVEQGKPYPFEDNTFDAVFLGHVIEHIDWRKVPSFLYDMMRVAKPKARFLITGPDVFKAIERYKNNLEPIHIVQSVLEHGRENALWEGSAHYWNCHHQRVMQVLENCGFSSLTDIADVIPKDTACKSWEYDGIVWPVVGHWYWQFAITCENRK